MSQYNNVNDENNNDDDDNDNDHDNDDSDKLTMMVLTYQPLVALKSWTMTALYRVYLRINL